MADKTRLSLVELESREVPAVAVPAPPAPPAFIPLAAPLPIVYRAPAWTPPGAATAPKFTGVAAPAPSTPSTPSMPAPTPSTPAPTPVPAGRFFSGSGSGTYLSSLLMLTTPSGFHMTGTATIAGMGTVEVYAHMYTVGFTTTGNARGELTLRNSKGTITLRLSGPEQSRLSPLPTTFTYTVIRATGSYSNVRESGTLRLTRTADAVPVKNGIRYFETGTFRLTM